MQIDPSITVKNASEHNLRSVTLEFPKNKLIVVTGVSGSGKSSLIFDVLYREAESRYLGSFSSFARQFMGKLKKPDVEKVEGLSPAVALDQKSVVSNPRSTVGTITGIYDSLRLLFARAGQRPAEAVHFPVNRSLFSFNSPDGACPACKGLGVEDFLDPELLVSDGTKTLREGALVITAPNGYIIYSQVTLDVLDQVCRSEGFHIDIPWKDLTPEQKHIVLYGSDKIEIPFGKHPLESRMKWSGITAKPRELGYYKGILPVMETILQRDRNKNILRFVRSGQCSACNGRRLNERALSVTIHGYNIAELAALQLDDLRDTLQAISFTKDEAFIARPIVAQVSKQVDLLKRLGLAYLSTGRDSTTLSGGESQRLRLATMAGMGLSNMICIFDEPSIGLHPHDIGQLIGILKEIRNKNNTVIVVEHDEEFIRHADWLIDIGPGPGVHGGEVLFNGPLEEAFKLPEPEIRKSRTLSFLNGFETIPVPVIRRHGSGFIAIEGAEANNLRNIDVAFRLQALNVVTGVSGAGKSTLTNHILGAFLKNRLHHASENVGKFREIKGWEAIGKLISIDQSPIGRTPRSNPATYTGVFDLIRDLFSQLPESIRRGYDKSRFSFNTLGGRCETCEGAGYQQIGMHFMGNVEVLCEVCGGRRFDADTLEIAYPADVTSGQGKNISEILEMTVSEAISFFNGEVRILRYLETLDNLGLGYLTLGQRSSTLSGGEAQRIKLATELAKPTSVHTLYIMNEPTTGLHQADTGVLLRALDGLVSQGHTVILTEHHPGLIAAADHVIDLGPGSGRDGGSLLFSGTPEEMVFCKGSLTADALKEYLCQINDLRFTNDDLRFRKEACPGEKNVSQTIADQFVSENRKSKIVNRKSIFLHGVSTHNLKHINTVIPHNKITVITGVSGSGKSSLAFDTIFAEGQNRFLESFSPYVRSRLGVMEHPDVEEISGLTPTFAVSQGSTGNNPRSTAGTMTGIYDHYRLLFARIGRRNGKEEYRILNIDQRSSNPEIVNRKSKIVNPSSTLFSFNHQHGACPVCDGLGFQTVCDADKLITDPQKPLPAGAMDGTKTGKFYGDPYGQYIATLRAVGARHGVDYNQPWCDVPENGKQLALEGTGDEQYEVNWQFMRDARTGEHHFSGPWKGLLNLVNDEYLRKHADHRGESMMALMKTASCPSCLGSRLRSEALDYTINGEDIAGLSSFSVGRSIGFFKSLFQAFTAPGEMEIASPLVNEILRKLDYLSGLGLSYLTIDRISSTLSGGEAQRIRLAGQLGSGLTGITYVLDEPTIGLHPRDTGNLMQLIRSLRDAGNTVIIVEHDRDVILAADHVIDIGPGAGKNGGQVVAEGTPEQVMNNVHSVTGPYLSDNSNMLGAGHGNNRGVLPANSRRPLTRGLTIRNAFANNLKGFDLEIPAGGIIAITGVSGSGKSTLLFEVVLASWENKKPTGCSSIEGFDTFQRVVGVHQRTGFSSPLATPATFTGIFEQIRNLFASLPDSKQSGFGKNSFSYLNRDGRCPVCEGTGQIRISMDFLPDVSMECEQCQGKRYRPEILSCTYHGRDIADILKMTVDEARHFFADQHNLCRQLGVLEQVGLGYLQLGQPLDTLSGGEAQRLALASELMKPGKGATLYLFEEPSTGLHFRDIEYLLALFQQLADIGNTLLIIEHDPMIIAQADHVIELGPEGGDAGGYLVHHQG
ncbi:MAG: excinuclease ABC subunit UvrA [Bacteroidetes bacterium]|nr:excinuclease ABC subunit UvrA [Bacteroidota bacterium]